MHWGRVVQVGGRDRVQLHEVLLRELDVQSLQVGDELFGPPGADDWHHGSRARAQPCQRDSSRGSSQFLGHPGDGVDDDVFRVAGTADERGTRGIGYVGPGIFDLCGVAFAAWTLAAFAIGMTAGMLIRRVVPAIAATLALWAGLLMAAGLFLRQNYAVPLVSTNINAGSSNAWIMAQWWTKGGTPISSATMNRVIQSTIEQVAPKTRSDLTPGSPDASFQIAERYLVQHGYTLWTRYQPASRFWPFQWIESGWLLALSLLLVAATIWLVRRRAT
jgi:hypothetical protein